MTAISAAVMQSMFNHLTNNSGSAAAYSEDEAREILVQKYPEQESVIKTFQISTASTEADAEEVSDTEKLATAVKAKTAKPKAVKPAKAPKAPKEAKVTKMDRARELYAAASDKSRKAMIDVFGKELGLSAAAASTYYYTVKG